MKKIACCTDFSENADAAFSMALELSEKFSAELVLIHVLPPAVTPVVADMEWALPEEPRDELMHKASERMRQHFLPRIGERVPHELIVLDGHVSSQILDFLEKNPVDLVVLGSYGLTGMGLVIFGSVAKRVAHKAPCSVMIARPADV